MSSISIDQTTEIEKNEKLENILYIQIRMLQQSNQELESLRNENKQMKEIISQLKELNAKTLFENEQLKQNLINFDQYLEIKEKYKNATEMIAELWIENQKLKEIK